MSLQSKDLETILEYVHQKDQKIYDSLLEELGFAKQSIAKEVHDAIFEEVKKNPEFRGPTGYSGLDGDRGPIGEQGPMGPMGPVPYVDVDRDGGRVRFQTGLNEGVAQFSDWINVKGEKGEALTWHDLTESQRQMLVGPTGDRGPQGIPGTFPKFQVIPEEFKIRWQVSEDIENPWGDWLDLPRGPQGIQGIKGERFVYEDFTPQQLEEIRGPQGIQGEKGDDALNFNEAVLQDDILKLVREDGEEFIVGNVRGPQGPQGERGLVGEQGPIGITGPKGKDASPDKVAQKLKEDATFLKQIVGPKGDKGDPGKDADVTPIEDSIKKLRDDLTKSHQKWEVDSKKQIKNDFEATKQDLISKINDVQFTRLNELLIPTAAFSVAGEPNGSEVVQEVGPFDNFNDIIDGAPIYIDNPIKASLRGEVYDPDNYIIYADASDVVNVADGIIFKGSGRYAYIYRIGVATVDPRVIADGPKLIPGEYYYLAHPKTGMPHSQITVNKPMFGIAQLVGQAVSETRLFVNCTTDPIILNRTEMKIQGSNGSYVIAPSLPEGNPGDAFGDVIWDDTYIYVCTRDYDGISKIWRRIAFDSTW